MRKGFAPILIVVAIFFFGIIALVLFKINYKPSLTDKIISPNNQQASSPSPKFTPDETANWKTYVNQKYNYSFKYPAEMITKNDESVTGQVEFPDVGGKVVDSLNLDLIPASSSDIDRIKAVDFNIVIGVIDGVNTPLSDYSRKYADKFYGKSGTLDQIAINGQPAYKISAPVAKTVQVLLESKNKNMVYTIASHQRASVKAEEYSKTFDQILSTFKFTN